MLLSFLITFISFALFFKSLPLKPLPTWAAEMRLVSLCFWEKSPFSLVSEVVKNSLFPTFSIILFKMSMKKKTLTPYLENVEKEENLLISDLPELVLECILERLSPQGLCSMAAVCSSMRERCSSDHLWERHMRQKWGKIIRSAAQREWKWQIATRKDSSGLQKRSGRGLFNLVSRLWPLSWIFNNGVEQKSLLPDDSIMSWYLALESGRFWFPAQVYNRENGHVGFMLSCYDAELRYDSCTDTFQARYPPHGRRAVAIEHCVPWERLRAPPIDTPPHDLHISECLNELCPNDNIEIQWRRNKEFPYGWWYGVVGHLESCGGNESQCHCRNSDTVVLVFNQYTAGSRWRRTTIHRKNHREEGNETDGFYGGVRKLCTDEDISMWRRLWPADVLE